MSDVIRARRGAPQNVPRSWSGRLRQNGKSRREATGGSEQRCKTGCWVHLRVRHLSRNGLNFSGGGTEMSVLGGSGMLASWQHKSNKEAGR